MMTMKRLVAAVVFVFAVSQLTYAQFRPNNTSGGGSSQTNGSRPNGGFSPQNNNRPSNNNTNANNDTDVRFEEGPSTGMRFERALPPGAAAAPAAPGAIIPEQNRPYTYQNLLATFRTPGNSGAIGSARYQWRDGSLHNDQLIYIYPGSVIETSGAGGMRIGTEVPVWVYEASDSTGNTIYFYFSVHPYALRMGRRWLVYYSFEHPETPGVDIRRYIVTGGTTRR